MIVPYAIRLLSVCLASFFLLHLLLAGLARAAAPFAIGYAERLATRRSARSAAGLLLALRFLPAVLAVAAVCALCLPSFLSFENERGSELAAAPFLLVAALGASVWGISIFRGVRAMLRVRKYVPRNSPVMECESESVLLWDGDAPFLGLTGAFRPRVVVSRMVARTLDADQLAAALRHERGHRASADNLKRLLLLLTPEALPGLCLFGAVDRAWSHFAEWAADDWAVAHDAGCSVALAEALVRVARLGSAPRLSTVVSPFIPPGESISTRVDRLLNGPSSMPVRRRALVRALLGVAACGPFAAACIPGSLSAVHQILERLMH
jgi:Zn-dependent protease with chaperone function